MAATFSAHPGTVDVPEEWWANFEPPPGVRAEIIRGALSLSPSPNDAHGVVQSFLIARFRRTMPDDHRAVPGIEWKFAAKGIVAMAPQLDVMVGRWDAATRTLVRPPILGVEVLSPSDTAPWEGMTRIEGKRLDYAENGLEHYLEIDLDEPSITRYELLGARLVAVDKAAADQILSTTVPFPYELRPSDLLL